MKSPCCKTFVVRQRNYLDEASSWLSFCLQGNKYYSIATLTSHKVAMVLNRGKLPQPAYSLTRDCQSRGWGNETKKKILPCGPCGRARTPAS